MRVDFTLSSLSDNEWPILRRVPGLGSKPLLAAELGEARGLECHPLQRPGGAVAGVRHRAALHRGAHAWRVGHSGFHLPRNPLTRIAKGQEAKNPPGLLRSDRQTTNFERLEFSLLITLCMRLPLQHDRSLLGASFAHSTQLPSRDAVGLLKLVGWKIVAMKSVQCDILRARRPIELVD